MRRIAIVIALTLYPAAPAVADTDTGNQLLAGCSAGTANFDSTTKQFECFNYIRGAADMAAALRVFCAPQGVTYGQIQDVVVNGLRNDPANRHHGSSYLIFKYLSASFPCRATNGTR
jgi:hypothetical protein